MKKFLTLLLAMAVLMPALPNLRAADDKKETELETAMGKMNGAFRKLRRQVTDSSKNAESLELVSTLRAAAMKSLDLVPAMAEDKPEAERPAFIAGYKKEMNEFLAALAPLEAALKANDNAFAEKLVADLGARQKKGHKEYKRPDKKG